MTEYLRDLQSWLTIAGADALSDADTILDACDQKGWLHGTKGDVIALGLALWAQPPRVLRSLTPTQGLALASQLFVTELLPGGNDPSDTAELARRVRSKVTALARGDDTPYDKLRQQAALAAVRQLGGSRKVAIPSWMELALGDPNWTACDHIIDEVELACRNTAPGRRWCYVYQLGFITYEFV